jgi:hypothetical protein
MKPMYFCPSTCSSAAPDAGEVLRGGQAAAAACWAAGRRQGRPAGGAPHRVLDGAQLEVEGHEVAVDVGDHLAERAVCAQHGA